MGSSSIQLTRASRRTRRSRHGARDTEGRPYAQAFAPTPQGSGRTALARCVVARLLVLLGVGALGLGIAAAVVGGATGTVLAYGAIPALGGGAMIAVCWACYGPRKTGAPYRGGARRHAALNVEPA